MYMHLVWLEKICDYYICGKLYTMNSFLLNCKCYLMNLLISQRLSVSFKALTCTCKCTRCVMSWLHEMIGLGYLLIEII